MTDRFGRVFGVSRGAGPLGPAGRWTAAEAWWRWGGGRFEELASWLDDLVQQGFERVELGQARLPSFWTIAVVNGARRERRELDTGAMLWLVGHWPEHLRDPERSSAEQVTGWLTAAAATRAAKSMSRQEARRAP